MREGVALLGSFEIPFPRLNVILRNAAFAEIVETAKAVLGESNALLGSFEKPVPRLDVILSNAAAFIVETAKPPLVSPSCASERSSAM